MAWSYLWVRLAGRLTRGPVSPATAMTLGAVPDYDVFLIPFGLAHHTISHSLVAWAPLFLWLVWTRGPRGLLYTVGIAHHFLFDDLLVGASPLLYPLNPWSPGLSLGLPSAADSVLEVGALAAMLLVMHKSRELRPLFASVSVRVNLWALVTLVVTTVFFAEEAQVSLIAYAFSRKALTVVSMGHMVLGALLVAAIAKPLLRPVWARPMALGYPRIRLRR